MGREAEINQATDAYMGNYGADLFGACVQDVEQAFRDGIEWADEHPVNVWHDASEEPAGDSWVILCEDDSGNCFCENKIIVVELFLNWQKSAEKVWLKRWAYVSDLLPKGGE